MTDDHLDFFIAQFKRSYEREPNLEELEHLITLAKNSDRSDDLIDQLNKKVPFATTMLLITVCILISFLNIVGIIPTDKLSSYLELIQQIPEDAWDILKIIVGFWFGGAIGSNLISKWKSY